MRAQLLPAFAILALSTPALADEDTDLKDGETEEQRDDRLANQAGKYSAGVKVRFPNGPGEDGEYGTFNWIGVDLHGKYNISDMISVGGTIYTAPVKPDLGMIEPKIFGGFMARPELRLGATIGAFLDVGFMPYGAVLLNEYDTPFYIGDYELAARVGPSIKVKANVVYLSFQPHIAYQAGDPEAITGFAFPVSAMLRASSLLKVSANLGIYSGDDFKLGASDGGRIALGLGVDIKVSNIAVHLGAGLASLLTDDEMGSQSLYPSIGKSLYFNLGLKYMK